MIIDKDKIKERTTAILLWGLPWGIVVGVLVFFKNQMHLDSFIANGSIVVLFVGLFYLISSYCSFIGFVLPLFVGKEENESYHLIKPTFKENFSKSAKRMVKKFANENHTEELYATCIVIHDFLLDYKDRESRKELSCYIPSVAQIKGYPFESLCMMLSSQEQFQSVDTDKYYNFELLLRTCLSEAE